MFDPKYFDSSSFEISTLDLKEIKIDFQIIHQKREVEKYLKECFVISFHNAVSYYEYWDYLKEKVIEYLMQNDSEELYQTEIETIHDIDDEQVKDYILNVLIDDLGIFSNFVSLRSENKEDKYITQFTLNLSEFLTVFESINELDENIKIFIEDFILGIRYKIDAQCIIKYMQYYSEIYDLEMELRKVLTYIFNNEYQDPLNLLTEYDLNILDKYTKENLTKCLENEFFHLCFSDYKLIALSRTKENKLKNIDILNILKNAIDFEDAQKKLCLGIKDEKHLSFLASIIQDIDSIQEMRNSIMHGRAYNKDIEDYNRSKAQLSRRIKEFWDNVKQS